MIVSHGTNSSTLGNLIIVYFQVSKVEGCKLVRQGDLDFDFKYGSCNSFVEPTPRILLCFDSSNSKACHT